MAEITDNDALALATELTIAWLGNPHTRVAGEDVPAFLRTMHNAVVKLSDPAAVKEVVPDVTEHTPAVTVRKSLASKDHIVSLIDGKSYKMLKRHLSNHGFTPEQYRERYNLKPDYPMVAENYGTMRRELAKKIGLGRKPGQAPEMPAKAKPKPRAEPQPSASAE